MSSQLRRTLASKSVSAIKKSKHNQMKKPYSEVSYGMDVDTVSYLMTGFAPTSDTKQMTKWLLHGTEVCDLLPDSMRMLHPPSRLLLCASSSTLLTTFCITLLTHASCVGAVTHRSARPHRWCQV